MINCKVGQKIICVEAFTIKRKNQEAYPVVGETYTVRGVVMHMGSIGILLEEIVNPERRYRDGMNEAAFSIDNFVSAEYQSAVPSILKSFPMVQERLDIRIRTPKNKNT